MSLKAQTTETYTDDPLLKVLSTLKNEGDAGHGGHASPAPAPMTPAQRKLAEQAKALHIGAKPGSPQSAHSAPNMEMTAAALRQSIPQAASTLIAKSPEPPAPVQAPPVQKMKGPPQPPATSAPHPDTYSVQLDETTPVALPEDREPPRMEITAPVKPQEPAAESGISAPKKAEQSVRNLAEESALEQIENAPAEAAAPIPEPVERTHEPVPREPEPEPEAKPAPAPEASLPVAQPVKQFDKISIDTPIPQIEIRDEEFDTVMEEDEEEIISRRPKEAPSLAPPAEEIPAEVGRSDALPLIGGGRTRASGGNRKGSSSTMKTVLAVLGVQGVLVLFCAGIFWASSDARASLRKFAHRVLGTSGVVAAAEPHWQPDLTPTTLEGSGNEDAFQQMGLMQGKITELERQLSVTPAEAWKELRLLSQRNQLTSYADEAITLGSRKAYMELKEVASTSKDTALRHAAEAELLRIRFFYASGSRLGTYKLPTSTLYPDGGSKKDEDLSSDELTTLLLDKTKDWEIRSRAAYLLGDRRGYEVARCLKEAVATDECLDVIEQAMYSFEEMTSYRSPGPFEIQHLVEWWDDNAERLKKSL